MIVFKNKLNGILLALMIAFPAWYLGTYFPLIGGPVFAILIGMILASIIKKTHSFDKGISFTSKYILQVAVVLLGFGLNLNQIMKVGLSSLPIILSTIATALCVAYLFSRHLKINSHIAILIGVGSSICGGSAIAATAPVIKSKDEQIAQAISVIFLFNIIAALIFPTLGQLIGLSDEGFALFAGTAVNDTSSVTATATAWDSIHQSTTLETATIVKLTRTLAIIPITLGLSLITQKKNQFHESASNFSFKRAFPSFLIYFIFASLITTIFTHLSIELPLFDTLKIISKFLITMAMGAIGFKTNLGKLLKTGGPAILLGGICWISIIIVSLCMKFLLKTW